MSSIRYGKYKGRSFEAIPAHYLLWIWDNGVHGEGSLLHDFIVENWDALLKRCPDYKVQNFPKPNGLRQFEAPDKPSIVTVKYDN